eukprot:GHUV01001231.1.p1 GENE.GHUV01001231.1~~GHUV01001231.1.p1  ORF type:complete len:285 (+),score=41.27 GHUV01001231.1:217-1071(+)
MYLPVTCAVTTKLQITLLLVVVTLAGRAAAANAPSAPTAPNAMALGNVMPDVSSSLRLISGLDNVADYLSNPNNVCTFFLPTNEANTMSIRRLGKYVGLAAQNETLQNQTYNYHIIPGRALTAADLMDMNQTDTRAGEILYIWHKGGKPYVYFRAEYPIFLNQTNIKAGNCIVHTVSMPLIPPSTIPMIQDWLVEQGTMPDYGPRSEWAPIRNQFQAELANATEVRQARAAQGRVQTESSTKSGTDTTKPATSSAGQGLGSTWLAHAPLWVLQGCVIALALLSA